MGKASKALKEFINDIPDSDLEALPTSAGTIYSNDNFRLDMQGVSEIGHEPDVSTSNFCR
jgi:hypothetical protein